MLRIKTIALFTLLTGLSFMGTQASPVMPGSGSAESVSSQAQTPSGAVKAEVAVQAEAAPAEVAAPAATKAAKSYGADKLVNDKKALRNSLKEMGLNGVEATVAANKISKLSSKSPYTMPEATHGEKSQIVALILCILVGALGIHRFYLGHIGIGVLMLLTGGLCGILTLIDLIRICTGDLKPKNGEYDKTF